MSSERDKELTLLNYILKAPEVYKDNKEELKGFKPEYPFAKPIYAILTETIDRYGVPPVLIEALTEAEKWADTYNWSKIQRSKLIEDVKATYALESSAKSGEMLLDHIFEKKNRELADKLLKSSPENFRRNFSEFQQSMNALNSLGREEKKSLGVAPMSLRDINPICAKIHESNTLRCMPTGFPAWDDKLLGGVRAGEVFMILGATGRGKSLLLLNIAYHNAVDLGKRFVFITMDNQMEEIGERWIARWLNRPINGAFCPDRTAALLEKKIKTGQEFNLILQTWQPQRHTVLDIERYLNELSASLVEYDKACGLPEEQWGHIDGVGIDYLEKLKALESSELLRRDIYLTCDECVGLAKRRSIPLFLNSQANIESLKSETSQIWMAGESSSKLQPPAHVCILSQSDEERQSIPMKMKIVVGKSRRPDTEYAVPIIVDKFLQGVWEDPDRPIVPLNSITSTTASAIKTKEEIREERTQDTIEAAARAVSAAFKARTLQATQIVLESEREYSTDEALAMADVVQESEMGEGVYEIRPSTPEEQAEWFKLEQIRLAEELTSSLNGSTK